MEVILLTCHRSQHQQSSQVVVSFHLEIKQPGAITTLETTVAQRSKARRSMTEGAKRLSFKAIE